MTSFSGAIITVFAKKMTKLGLLVFCLGSMVGLSACRGEQSSSTASPTPAAVATASPDNARVAATPTPASSPQSKTSPEVPEMLKRAFTKEEMEKAMQQLPPEVRARIQGLSYAPAGVRPNAAPTPSPSPTPKRK